MHTTLPHGVVPWDQTIYFGCSTPAESIYNRPHQSRMADFKQSDLKSVDLIEHTDNPKEDVDVLRSLRGVAALEVAGRLEPPKKTSKRMFQLYGICGLMFLGSTMVSDCCLGVPIYLPRKPTYGTKSDEEHLAESLCLYLAGAPLLMPFKALLTPLQPENRASRLTNTERV